MNKWFLIALIFILSIVAVACGPVTPSPTSVETAIAQTQAAIPTPTILPSPTPVALSEINLEEILLLEGDLPLGFEGGQIKSNPPKMFENVPHADQIIQQEFRAGDFASDGIVIFLYESTPDLEQAYSIVTKVLDKDNAFTPLSDVGEKAIIFEEKNSLFSVTSSKVVFLRCQALVYIDLFGTSVNADVATTYAQRLDKRIKSIVCP